MKRGTEMRFVPAHLLTSYRAAGWTPVEWWEGGDIAMGEEGLEGGIDRFAEENPPPEEGVGAAVWNLYKIALFNTPLLGPAILSIPGLGDDNTRAMLLARGLQEVDRKIGERLDRFPRARTVTIPVVNDDLDTTLILWGQANFGTDTTRMSSYKEVEGPQIEEDGRLYATYEVEYLMPQSVFEQRVLGGPVENAAIPNADVRTGLVPYVVRLRVPVGAADEEGAAADAAEKADVMDEIRAFEEKVARDLFDFRFLGVPEDKAAQWSQTIVTQFDPNGLPAALVDKVMVGETAAFQDRGTGSDTLGEVIRTGSGLALGPNAIAQQVKDMAARLADDPRRDRLIENFLWDAATTRNALVTQAVLDEEALKAAQDRGLFRPEPPRRQRGGGGFGFRRPPYVPPDRREIEENVRNYMALVVGKVDEPEVQRLTDLYMQQHRWSYDNPSAGLRPFFTVKEEIRKRPDYQRLHALRPDTVREEEWLSQFGDILKESGVDPTRLDTKIRDFATVGASRVAARAAAFRFQEQTTGRPSPLFARRMRGLLSAVAQRF